jgi:hypothetical protein
VYPFSLFEDSPEGRRGRKEKKKVGERENIETGGSIPRTPDKHTHRQTRERERDI